MSEKPTRKANEPAQDHLRTEYQRSDLVDGVRGKYYQRHMQGTNLVLLQPEVAKVFSTPQAVNQALLGLMQIAQQATKQR